MFEGETAAEQIELSSRIDLIKFASYFYPLRSNFTKVISFWSFNITGIFFVHVNLILSYYLVTEGRHDNYYYGYSDYVNEMGI